MQNSLDKTTSSFNNGTNGNGPSQANERTPSSAVAVSTLKMAGLPASERESQKRRFLNPKSKPMRSRQLYIAATATSTGAIYFDVPSDTTIRQVTWSVLCSSSSAADTVQAEISTSSSASQAVNDAQGVLSVFAANVLGGGSPANASSGGWNHVTPTAWSARKGDRIYLNISESGGATWSVRALVWFD